MTQQSTNVGIRNAPCQSIARPQMAITIRSAIPHSRLYVQSPKPFADGLGCHLLAILADEKQSTLNAKPTDDGESVSRQEQHSALSEMSALVFVQDGNALNKINVLHSKPRDFRRSCSGEPKQLEECRKHGIGVSHKPIVFVSRDQCFCSPRCFRRFADAG